MDAVPRCRLCAAQLGLHRCRHGCRCDDARAIARGTRARTRQQRSGDSRLSRSRSSGSSPSRSPGHGTLTASPTDGSRVFAGVSSPTTCWCASRLAQRWPRKSFSGRAVRGMARRGNLVAQRGAVRVARLRAVACLPHDHRHSHQRPSCFRTKALGRGGWSRSFHDDRGARPHLVATSHRGPARPDSAARGDQFRERTGGSQGLSSR